MEKIAENFKIFQKFGVSRQTLDKIQVPEADYVKIYSLKNILINFHIFFIL